MPIILLVPADCGAADGLEEVRANRSAFRLRNARLIALSRSIASLAFDASNSRQCVDGSALVGMRVKPDSAGCSDPAPVTHQQRAAEQVRPDFHPIVPPLVHLRANTR
jgi:hypothetical protein